jgi:hypothetical protein
MPELIKELKSEHLKISYTLKDVKELGILTHKGQAKLMSVKSFLIEHFNKENEKFYPVLYKAAEQNKKLKELLELLANGLETVSIGVTEFFDKYSKEVLDTTMFMEEFENLFLAICKRMMCEQFILYDEYEELNKL